MYLKKSKAEIAYEARNSAISAIHSGMSNLHFSNYENFSIMKEKIATLIAEGIAAGIESVLTNLYTDDDFEKDVGLK